MWIIAILIALFGPLEEPVSTPLAISPANWTDTLITVEKLSRRWELDKYQYLIFSELPTAEEQGDYLCLNSNMTFSSVSEGELETGKWQFDAAQNRLYLSQVETTGALVLIIHELSSNRLVISIDDPSDADAKKLKIHFKN